MWRLTWRLATVGIPFKFESQVPTDEFLKRIRRRSVWAALRSKEESGKVAFRLHRDHLTAYVTKVSIWVLIHPVFYADVKTVGTTVTVSGRFLFQKIVRITTWLMLSLALIYEGIWLYRCISRVREGLPWDLLLGYFAMLLPSFVVVAVTSVVLVRFTKQNVQDMNLLIDELKVIATQ